MKYLQKLKFFLYRFITLFLPGFKKAMVRHELIRHFKNNQLNYWTNNNKEEFRLNYQGHKDSIIEITICLAELSNLITISSHFVQLSEDQLNEAAVLCSHLNTFINIGYLGVNFRDRNVYYYHTMAQSDWLLTAQGINDTLKLGVCIPMDVGPCFDMVLEEGENPVVVVGQFMKKMITNRQQQAQ